MITKITFVDKFITDQEILSQKKENKFKVTIELSFLLVEFRDRKLKRWYQTISEKKTLFKLSVYKYGLALGNLEDMSI